LAAARSTRKFQFGKRVSLVVLASFQFGTPASAATDESLPDEPSPWERIVNVRPGFGYKDNLALSRTDRAESLFVSTELDLAIYRLPIDNKQFTASLIAADTRFLENEDIQYEQYLAATTEFKMAIAAQWNVSAGLEYAYFNEILDVTTIETNLTAMRVQGHRFGVRPLTLRRSLIRNFWVQADARLNRQFFKQPLDDFWEPGGQISFGSDYGFLSSASLSYGIKQLVFDTKNQTTRDGVPLPGQPMRYTQHDAELSVRHNWDKQRRWRSTTRLGFQVNADNGSGFYDYYRYQAAQQMSYVAHGWDLRASAKASYYDFHIQRATLDDSSTRAKTLLTFSLRAEKRLFKQFKVFTEWEHERSISNRRLEEYFVNQVVAGIDFEL
jgi:hypothetical protein